MPTRRISLILSLLALPSLSSCSSQPPAGPPPPSEEALASLSEEPGAPGTALARSVDAIFDESSVGETRALVVMRGGEVVAERYAPGYAADTRLIGWSMSKCVTGLLVGLLVSDGRLRLDEGAPVPDWRRPGDPRGEVTLRQLLQMRSGLRHAELSDPPYEADTVRMLFLDGRDDMAAYAEAQPLRAEPGRQFGYSSATSMILSDLVARSLTRSDDPARRRAVVSDFLASRLTEPAGMDSMTAEYDAAGTIIGSSMIYATARDWARLGEFFRHGGSVDGAQVVPRRWIDFMTSPSPRNASYGGHMWLNKPDSRDGEIRFPGAPETMFACMGHLGQYALASREKKLTVVRLGHTAEEDQPELRRRLAELVALFPG
ncbi:hypothetical protein GCM10011371_15930 [Novosphingobium marinum]|uniref:CubicO group peptidase (Beta-lactamase class C family) n=1 Tax=Novosphingobium marinum TaxID=1514948 RepID=A0A7Z0BW01_9SPHN|nr:serine hydrolase [Novosphingobium marinum]NYH95707.1 CubicO group peptidase (beta-lactamase class C family) [Novosphingobium marinum]GGC29231.1 hypothetical protein GCM10011371_15930 [Novosphingobium marinum]